ncbi:DNA-binding protein [Cupriavidus sp. CV2]|uniref:DNA-binding protein n=1 Tax=Cupriavidus ulmosensis TaxID=3065913 RepID=UPI00296B4AA8|nr:DNA-binding protein [Cupriavidus sp. CV2]MDW3688363.1 DNA-binding protein [Cupriavidus sp. CV2]
MARIGIAYEVVAAAADALLAEGRKATLAAVRERIGTGSMNTIHRHWTIWQGHQKPVPRKLSEPNTRLLSALGSELSKVAEEAASEADAALAQAMHEPSVYSANGEALEAERDALAEQLLQITTERDTLAGKAAGQSAEIERLTQDAERERDATAVGRRMLAQAELRLEAVPRLEEELVQLRAQLVAEQTVRTEADKMAAVAEARRAAAEAAQAQAEARLASAEQREGRVRVELAEAQAAHQSTRERLTEAVGVGAGAQAELKARRERQAETQGHAELDAHSAGSDAQRPARSRKPVQGS